VCLSSEEDIGTKRKQHTPLPQPLSDVKPIRMLYARELACLHGSGGGLHISWYLFWVWAAADLWVYNSMALACVRQTWRHLSMRRFVILDSGLDHALDSPHFSHSPQPRFCPYTSPRDTVKYITSFPINECLLWLRTFSNSIDTLLPLPTDSFISGWVGW